MRVALQDARRIVLSIEPGEELVGEIEKFCQEQDYRAAKVVGVIGAVSSVELAWYDLPAKEYKTKSFNDDLEIASAMGSVSEYDEKLVVHLHGVFSDRDYQTLGGHIKSAVISAAGEVTLIKLEGELKRTMNDGIGLPLL